MKNAGPLIGVLGGMGPLATADFLRKWALATPADCDQQHPSFIAYSDPATPDRSAAILGHGASPLPKMILGLEFLERNGADAIVIPCNTAHFWLEPMTAKIGIPIISIFDGVAHVLSICTPSPARVGILGTAGTLRSGLYQRELARRNYEVLVPDTASIESDVEPTIRSIKAGDFESASDTFARAVRALKVSGAQAIILGCTELPLAFDHIGDNFGIPVIDSTAALGTLLNAWIGDFVDQRQAFASSRPAAVQGSAR